VPILTRHPTVPTGWETWSLPGVVTVRYPSQWLLTPYLSGLSTVVFPLAHVSTAPLPGPCGSSEKSVQIKANCFNKTWPVTPDGVLVEWTETQFPTEQPLKSAHGKRVRIDGRPARLDTERSGDGTWTITAAIGSTVKNDGEATLMTAQVGRKATQATIDDVFTMLATVNISR
jgi:hypothetical protein